MAQAFADLLIASCDEISDSLQKPINQPASRKAVA
jgi:hypothetical protein